MAFIDTCGVCTGQTLNEHNHADCEVARLKDILYRAQTDLKKRGKLSAKTQKAILTGSFTPLKKFLEEKRKQNMASISRETQRRLRNLDLAHKRTAKSKLRFGDSPCLRRLQL